MFGRDSARRSRIIAVSAAKITQISIFSNKIKYKAMVRLKKSNKCRSPGSFPTLAVVTELLEIAGGDHAGREGDYGHSEE